MSESRPSQSRTLNLPPAAEDGDRLEIGAQVGRFRVVALLGQGGMGAVFKVWDPVLERHLALKAVRIGRVDDPAILERFKREALALAQLNHRNVCQVHDWVEWEGRAFIAMELLEGQTLTEAAKALDLKGKLRVLRAIARALEFAHAKGIVHRDLKPSNVMVDAGGQVKVLDFGLARFVEAGEALEPELGEPTGFAQAPGSDEITSVGQPVSGEATILDAGPSLSRPHASGSSLTLAGSFMGSPAYASPEQMVGQVVGPPSDLFSFGVLAWELLLGDHPFPGSGRERMAASVAGKRKSLKRRRLPMPVATLLKALLQRDPAKRPTAAQVVAALERQLKPLAVGWWIAISAASVLLLVGAAYLLFGRSAIADLVKERPPRLAVMPIRNETGEAKLNAQVEVGMAELLSTALRGTQKLAVLDGETVARTFTNLRLDPTKAPEEDRQRQIARAAGAALFLQGSVKRLGEAYEFSYALKEPSGKVRLSGRIEARAQDFASHLLVDPAVGELLGKVDPLHAAPARALSVPPEAFARYIEGKARTMKGDFKGAEPLLKEAAHRAPFFAAGIAQYGAALRRLGQQELALPVVNWAFVAAKATGDRWAETRALQGLAFLAKDRGDLDESERLRRASLVLAQASGDLDAKSVAINHLGLIAAERGRDEEAKALYEQALQLGQQIQDKLYISLALNNLANLALKRGDAVAAMESYKAALAIQQEIGNRWGEALALNNLGVTALTMRDLGSAEGFLNRALLLRQSGGDKAGQATCQRNLGLLHQMRGDLPAAEGYLQQALDTSREAAVRAIEAECHFCLGEVLRLQGRLRPALDAYRQTLELLANGLTPEIRSAAEAARAECEARLAPARLKELEARLEATEPGARSPYWHRAMAWLHHLAGRPAQAAAALEAARLDPRHQAPEIQGELVAMKALFAKGK